jgi:hypothetical protein
VQNYETDDEGCAGEIEGEVEHMQVFEKYGKQMTADVVDVACCAGELEE